MKHYTDVRKASVEAFISTFIRFGVMHEARTFVRRMYFNIGWDAETIAYICATLNKHYKCSDYPSRLTEVKTYLM
jgi:hypothetical protein